MDKKQKRTISKELLNEFLIVEYGDNYAVSPTDKAYELLGLENKERKLRSGNYAKTIDDWYFRVALATFLANNYQINGLMRESRGNSHDASWVKEVFIIDDGGPWSDKLNSYRNQKNSTYENKPIIINKEKISEYLIEEWANEFDLTGNGEENEGRLIFCSYRDGSERFCYTFKPSHIIGLPTSKKYNEKIHYQGIYLQRLKKC